MQSPVKRRARYVTVSSDDAVVDPESSEEEVPSLHEESSDSGAEEETDIVHEPKEVTPPASPIPVVRRPTRQAKEDAKVKIKYVRAVDSTQDLEELVKTKIKELFTSIAGELL